MDVTGRFKTTLLKVRLRVELPSSYFCSVLEEVQQFGFEDCFPLRHRSCSCRTGVPCQHPPCQEAAQGLPRNTGSESSDHAADGYETTDRTLRKCYRANQQHQLMTAGMRWRKINIVRAFARPHLPSAPFPVLALQDGILLPFPSQIPELHHWQALNWKQVGSAERARMGMLPVAPSPYWCKDGLRAPRALLSQ